MKTKPITNYLAEEIILTLLDRVDAKLNDDDNIRSYDHGGNADSLNSYFMEHFECICYLSLGMLGNEYLSKYEEIYFKHFSESNIDEALEHNRKLAKTARDIIEDYIKETTDIGKFVLENISFDNEAVH